MVDPLVVVGAGGFGREVVDVIEAINAASETPRWSLIGVVDDGPSEANLKRLKSRGIAHLGSVAEFVTEGSSASFVVGIGDPSTRRRIADDLTSAHLQPATLIHPAATVGSEVQIGVGTVVCAGARVTTNIRIGRHVHINPNVTVGHDTKIGDFVSLNPGCSVSGDCAIENEALIGVGGVILNGVTIGAGATVGGSACATKDVSVGNVVKGVPAQ